MKHTLNSLVARRVRPRIPRAALCRATALLALPLLPTAAQASGLCGPWDHVETPNVGNSVTRLTAVTVLSPEDAWSVGYWRNEPSGRGPLALRWDGSDWALMDLPETSHLGTFPETAGVDAAPNGDVWAVGNVTTTYPTNNLPLMLRWRNGAWDYAETATLRPQTVYPYAARGGFAYEVDALAADDIWAVGLANGFGDAQASSVPMALHWDGSSWTDVDVPIVANRHHELRDLVAISSDDVWAVGDYRNIAGAFRGVTYHWDGNAWSHVYSPIEEVLQSGLEDVAATGPNDVWALGGADGIVILMHWDGLLWTLAEPPPNSGGSLAAGGPNDLWVSGWNGFWHWDGTSWTDVPASVAGATYVIRSGGMEIVDECDIWSVGFWTLEDGLTSFTLAERLQPHPAAVVTVERGETALAFANPYRPGSEIRFSPPTTRAASLSVHDLQGRLVRQLFHGSTSAGERRFVRWDGRGQAGGDLAAGVYFMRLETGTTRIDRKLLLVEAGR